MQLNEGNKMKDGGAIILFVLGLFCSLQPIALFIIDPYVKNKEGTPTKYSKIKIILSLLGFLYFLVMVILDLFGFFNM